MGRDLYAQFILKLQDQVTGDWKRINAQISGNASGLGSLFKGLGPIIAGAFSVHQLKEFAEAASQQELATARLSQALANAGDASSATLARMEEFSSSMQRITTFGDEAVTEVQAMIVAMTGLTGSAVEPLTRASLDLASGLNMDATSVAQLIGKTLAGQDALGRYGISVKGARNEHEKINAIIDQTREKFGGFAEAEAETTTGKLRQLSNAVGDFKEELGFVLLEGGDSSLPTLISFVQDATEAIGPLLNFFDGLVKASAGMQVFLPMLIQEFALFTGLLDEDQKVLKDWDDWLEIMTNSLDRVISPVETFTKKSRSSFAPVKQALDETNAALDTFSGKIQPLAARGVVFITPEQEKRVNAVIAGLEWYKRFAAQSKTTQDALIISAIEEQRAGIVLDKVQEIKAIKTEISDQELFSKFKEENAVIIKAIETWSSILVFNMNSAWRATFGEANSLFEQFAQQMVTFFTQELLADIGNSLLSLLPGGGIIDFIGSIFGFHHGGTVPKAHGGAFVMAPPSREFPILVRGGETIRTEAQENALRNSILGPSQPIIINQTFYGSSPSMARQVVEALREATRQTGQSLDQLVVNKRSNIHLAVS